MTMEREKEREWELEGAMYTNCLLLGLDLSSLTAGNGGHGSAAPRLGLFRHSNPRLGEQLLYFLLSSVRGPAQSAKDFDKLWPIFDSAQSRDFRKVVQSIISELESQGALPRSNSRVSSLATCCGPRFVELLWQLSVHALREVHRRTFADDVAANPLPSSLTDASYSHASALLPVTKARIALERRKFLKTANTAVQTQAMWASLAQDITAEFRGLCVEEAYLQQELEKIQDLRNKSKLEGELWDDRGSSSLSQNSHMVSKATRLWESLLARKTSWGISVICGKSAILLKGITADAAVRPNQPSSLDVAEDSFFASVHSSILLAATACYRSFEHGFHDFFHIQVSSMLSQHEVLASGPIEDLIAHREHRYRISGSALLAAMDQSSQLKPDLFSDQASDVSVTSNNHDICLNKEGDHEIINATPVQAKDEGLAKMDERSGRVHPTVDIAETLRRWTHALQRIHKQAIHLAKANDGEGPDLLRSASDGTSNGHADSLSAALSEHSQHLASIEAFVNQLKEVVPTMEKSIAELTEEVNSSLNVSSNNYDGRSTTPNQAQSSGRFLGSSSDEVQDITSKLSSVQLDMIPPSIALKLPQLFSINPNLSTKSSNLQNCHAVASLVSKAEPLPDSKLGDQPSSNGYADNSIQGGENSYAQSIRRSVREAALPTQLANSDAPQNSRSDGSLEHYFVPFQMTNDSTTAANRSVTNRRKQRLFAFPADASEPKSNKTTSSPLKTSKLDESCVPAPTNGFLSVDLDSAVSNPEMRGFADETQEQIFSPPLLMDVSGFGDAYEDLLAPLSEVDAALMEK